MAGHGSEIFVHGDTIEVFGVHGSISRRGEWRINSVQVQPTRTRQRIEELLDIVIDAGKVRHINQIRVCPHAVVRLFLEECLTRGQVRLHRIGDQGEVIFRGVRFTTQAGQREFDVATRRDFPAEFSFVDAFGGVIDID